MTKDKLIKKLQEMDCPGDTEVMIQEEAMNNAHSICDVDLGWYVDDGYDAPEVITDTEHPEDYDIDPKEPKVIVIG